MMMMMTLQNTVRKIVRLENKGKFSETGLLIFSIDAGNVKKTTCR